MLKKILILFFCCTVARAVNPLHLPHEAMDENMKCPFEHEHTETPDSTQSMILADRIIKEAMTHMGKRYRWGDVGPKTFDCSGFTSYVYRHEGLEISRTSRAQYHDGEEVQVKDLQKGDLVFFSRTRNKNRITHVGIVTETDTSECSFKFIHASIHGVKIDSFPDKTYYKKHFVSACRIFNDSIASLTLQDSLKNEQI